MMKHSNVHYSRFMIVTALKICTRAVKYCIFQFISKKYIRSIVGRAIPDSSKNTPFWKSIIELLYFIYAHQNLCIIFVMHSTIARKRLEWFWESLRNRTFHKNFMMIITLDNTSSNTWARHLRVNPIYQCFKVK